MSRKLSWIALFLGVATFGTTLYLSLDWHWSCTPQGTVHVGTVFSCTVANWDFIQNISGVAAGSAMFTVGASAIEHKSGNKFASWLALFGVSIILIAVPSYFLLVAPTTINTGLRYYLVTSSGQQISTQFPCTRCPWLRYSEAFCLANVSDGFREIALRGSADMPRTKQFQSEIGASELFLRSLP
jgi:hypothetical protein